MKGSLSLFALGAVLRSVYAQSAPPASYGEAFPKGLGVLDPNGLNNIPSPGYTVNRWAWGTIPQICYDIANNNGYCNPYDVEVYDVTYSDCSYSFQFCRCNNAGMTVNQVADRFGRVPVAARQYVRTVNIYSGNACSAWANGLDLSFFGDCSNAESVFLHENTHNLDYWVAGGGSWYSQSQDWKNTVAKGSCVADNYAKSTYTEAFAQVGVMAFYNANVGSIWNYNVGCMADQVGRTIELLGDTVVYSSSRTCNRVWAHSTPTCMGPAARDSGNCPNLKKPPTPIDPSITVAEGEAVADEVVETLKREAEVSAGLLKKRHFSA